jgi:selenocysteine-specific elongation factor
VRGLQSLGRPFDQVTAVARVAVNLRNVDKEEVARGDALLTPGAWASSALMDVRIRAADAVPAQLVLHLGSAAVPVRVRPLGDGTVARLTLNRALAVAAGDRALLRDPGGHRVVGRVTILDTDPPPLTRRGAAAARAKELAGDDPATLLRRRKLLRAAELRGLGVRPPADARPAGEWLIDASYAGELRKQLATVLADYRRTATLSAGPTVEEARTALGVPDRAVVLALIAAPLTIRDGRVVDREAQSPLPAPVAAALAELARDLADQRFRAPEAGRLAALGLGARELAAAERAGALLRVSDTIVLLPGADVQAVGVLSKLEQPFTTSQARQALDTTRRVALPLLDLLDRRHLTRRLPDDRREVMP